MFAKPHLSTLSWREPQQTRRQVKQVLISHVPASLDMVPPYSNAEAAQLEPQRQSNVQSAVNMSTITAFGYHAGKIEKHALARTGAIAAISSGCQEAHDYGATGHKR